MRDAHEGGPLSQEELAAWRGFLRVHSALIRALDAELATAHDLSLHAYEVLLYLHDAPDGRLRMTELSHSVLLSASGITRLVDRLEARGLVCRSPCELDGRGYWAALTEAGATKLAAARPTHLAGVRRLFLSQVGKDELVLLGRVWERVVPGASAP